MMDHGNAQSTFVEIAFGLNTIFTIYPGFRDRLGKMIANSVNESVAVIQSIEPTKADAESVNRIASQIAKSASEHIRFQTLAIPWAVAGSLMSAAFCVLIAYFDWFECVGMWSILLLAPLLAFFATLGVNYSIFTLNKWRKVGRYSDYVKEFGCLNTGENHQGPEEG